MTLALEVYPSATAIAAEDLFVVLPRIESGRVAITSVVSG